jgi:hypothetical protein
VGIITSIEGANNYTITTSGFVDVVAAVPTATAGTVYFLAEADDSQLTSTEPTTVGAVSKPVAVVTESNAKMILIHYRGEVITSAVVANAPNDAQYVTLAVDGSLSAERVLTAGSGITLTDAGANGAATISIANDAIDSQHYAGTSIDNEHLAANAVTTAKIADSQVTLAKLDNTARETNIQLVVIDFATALTTGNGKFYFYVPATLNGFNIVAVHAEVITAPAGSVATFMLHNVTSGADILSTAITIDAGETGSDSAATAAVISSSEDDLTTHDIIRVDIDGVGSGTAGSGLIINMTCRLP